MQVQAEVLTKHLALKISCNRPCIAAQEESCDEECLRSDDAYRNTRQTGPWNRPPAPPWRRSRRDARHLAGACDRCWRHRHSRPPCRRESARHQPAPHHGAATFQKNTADLSLVTNDGALVFHQAARACTMAPVPPMAECTPYSRSSAVIRL